MEYLKHRGVKIPLIGIGTFGLGFNANNSATEENTVRTAIETFGMTLIDTAESYGDGVSELFLSGIIKDYPRENLFIVDKIHPENAEKNAYSDSCRRSLDRLGIASIDLYLLHWREDLELGRVADNMEELVRKGLIKHWGVSNFDTDDMTELFDRDNGKNCFCNQILYNIATRSPEYELIPWCKNNDVLVTAYSPLCHSNARRLSVAQNPIVIDVAKRTGKTPESLMLSFIIGTSGVTTVFKTSDISRLKNNMQNVFSPISDEDLNALSRVFKAPRKRTKLKTI